MLTTTAEYWIDASIAGIVTIIPIINIEHLIILANEQWRKFLMISSVSRAHFFWNIVLIVVCVLQVTVSKEQKDDVINTVKIMLPKKRAKKRQLKVLIRNSMSYLSSHSLLKREKSNQEITKKDEDDIDKDAYEDYEEKDGVIDKCIRFITMHITKITCVLILILSASYISIISAIYFIYILYFCVNPVKLKVRNSFSTRLLLFLSYLHLLSINLYQLPSFQEINYCSGNFCIQVFRTIGLSKFVSVRYEGEPICYSQLIEDEIVECSHPLSITGMLPVMLIVVILYLQKVISNSTAYDMIDRNLKVDEKKGERRREVLVDGIINDYSNRQEGKWVF